MPKKLQADIQIGKPKDHNYRTSAVHVDVLMHDEARCYHLIFKYPSKLKITDQEFRKLLADKILTELNINLDKFTTQFIYDWRPINT